MKARDPWTIHKLRRRRGRRPSTQVGRLVARLQAVLGERKVVRTREPGGSKGAEVIRNLVVATDAEPWSAMTETLLMYASRSDHLERTIRPALAAGDWVVCDRFADSSRAYQGAGGGVAQSFIEQIDAGVVGVDQPDLTLVLTCRSRSAWSGRSGAACSRRGSDQGSGVPSAAARGLSEDRRGQSAALRADRRGRIAGRGRGAGLAGGSGSAAVSDDHPRDRFDLVPDAAAETAFLDAWERGGCTTPGCCAGSRGRARRPSPIGRRDGCWARRPIRRPGRWRAAR